MSREISLPPASLLSRPVTSLAGVGPERAALLGKLEIRTVEDLLLHRPRRYEDRQKLVRIAQLQLRESAITNGKIVAMGTKWFKQHTKSIFEIILDDGTGRLHCRWWNLAFMEKYFAVGDQVLVFGRPVQLKPRTIDHPETEILEGGEENFIHLNRLTPVYPLTEGLGQRWLRALIWRTLEACESGIQDPWRSELRAEITPHPDLPSRAQAIRHIHFPEKEEEIERARMRLALDEFVALQCQIQFRRKNFETKAQALPCGGDNHLIKPFLKTLGFKLTPSQAKVLRELRNDMSGPHPMRRLLQGDVGSGKTLVAACSALMALESGFGVALMAPTEILAEQHFETFSRWFKPLAVPVHLRTGTYKSPASIGRLNQSGQETRRTLESGHAEAKPEITIGTHALIESGFSPEKLGLVMIDEQHRFGVVQREKLLRKGQYPHLLVMTATPIPRTLGLTLYGDLDVSVIDEAPPGRRPIKTYVRGRGQLPKVWAFIRSELSKDRQAYIVYPHIDETNQLGIKAVRSEFENLCRELAPFRVGMLHGRIGTHDREKVMEAFRSRELNVLLATSVIEVGIDIPNATLMVIENAEQFGLAQLHQLRGRIGRSAYDSYCILVSEKKVGGAHERLRVLEQTTDGFRMAEADLKLRGPGELLGHAQSGMPPLRFGDLANDLDLIKEARLIAARIIAQAAVAQVS
jgi:ATP-dependent DNA helicase RecG